jgi:mannose-binding lectin 1
MRQSANFSAVVQASKPRMSFFVFIIVASQVMLLISWAVYKRRMKNQPKKYL